MILDHNGRPFSANGASSRGYDPSASSFHPNGFADEGYGSFPLPHIATFNAIYSSGSQTYWQDRWDEAIRMARENALVMRRDAFLMSLLQERKLAVASIPWELEIPDEKDARQRLVRDTIKRAIEGIADLRRILFALLEAVWYGRYAVEVEWEWIKIHGKKVLTVADWFPINGDKLGWNFNGVPYVLTNATVVQPRDDVELVNTTAGGRGLLLKGTWRDRFFIHRHEMDDADYFEGESAGGVWGVGVRSRIFWMDWVRREYMEWITTFLERVGLGVTLWYYDGGNPQALNAVAAAAKNQSRRANLFVPIFSDGKGSPRGLVERIETPVNGVDALRMLKEDIEQKIERFIVGQEASSKGEGASGLGNQASAKFQWNTKDQITAFDAQNLAETLTGNSRNPGLVYLIQRWSFPDTMPDQPGGFRVKWKFGVEKQDPEKRLTAAEKVIRLGVPVKADEVRSVAGFTKPDVGDEVISLQAGGAPGAPGGEPQPGKAGPGAAGQPQVTDPNADSGFEPPFPVGAGSSPQEQMTSAAGGEFMYERERGHEYASTQAELDLGDGASQDAARAIRAMQSFIREADLADNGIEDCLHVTVKYGLDADDPRDIARVVAGFGKIRARLRKTSLFSGDEADVLKIDVDSECLHRLNALVCEKLPHTDTYPTYKPHVTLAYLKPGRGKHYDGMAAVDGYELSFDKITFSDRDGFKTTIDLLGGAGTLSEYERQAPSSNVTAEMIARKANVAQQPPHQAAPPGWTVYHGARGGIGWKNTMTGKVLYATSGRDPCGRKVAGKPTRGSGGIPIATPAARRRINGMALANWYADHWNLLAELGMTPDDREKHEAGLELYGSGAGIWFDAQGDKQWHAVKTPQEGQEQQGGDLAQYAAERAPVGGITINGQFYNGGEWIPGNVMEKATPEQRQQIDAQAGASASAKMARGPVNMEALRTAISPHAGMPLKGEQLRAARQTFDSMMQAHGELLMHRIEELAQGAQKVLATLTPDMPQAAEIRQRFTERMASLARMVDWAEEHGMTPSESDDPSEKGKEEPAKQDVGKKEKGSGLPPKSAIGENYRRPLSDFAPSLYSEMSVDKVGGLTPNSSGGFSGGVGGGQLFFANSPTLATGQGGNKGVLVKFKSDGIEGQVNTSKPSWGFAWDNGEAEFVARNTSEKTLKNNVEEIRLTGKLERRDKAMLKAFMGQMGMQEAAPGVWRKDGASSEEAQDAGAAARSEAGQLGDDKDARDEDSDAAAVAEAPTLKLPPRYPERLKSVTQKLAGLTKDSITQEVADDLIDDILNLGFDDYGKVGKALGLSREDFNAVRSKIMDQGRVGMAAVKKKQGAPAAQQPQPSPSAAPGKPAGAGAKQPRPWTGNHEDGPGLEADNPQRREPITRDTYEKIWPLSEKEMNEATGPGAGQPGRSLGWRDYADYESPHKGLADEVAKVAGAGSGPNGDMSIHELFSQMQKKYPSLTVPQLHGTLMRLSQEKKIGMRPYTRARTEIDSSYAIPSDGELFFWVSKPR